MKQNYLPALATTTEACAWLQDETAEPWTLARLIECNLMPWFWLDYRADADAVFAGRKQGYLAPLCFAGDAGRLAAGGHDVLVTMTRNHAGEIIGLPPGSLVLALDDVRFRRDDLTQLASKFDAPRAKAGAVAGTTPGDGWKEQARAIADECFDHDTAMGCRDSLKGYSGRVMDIMQERGIKGARGIIDNTNYVMREALQGDAWWKSKLK